MTGDSGGDGMGQAGSLARNLVSLVDAVAELRVAQAHAAQTAAARQAAEQLYAAFGRARDRVPPAGGARAPVARPGSRADAEFPVPVTEVLAADRPTRRPVWVLRREWRSRLPGPGLPGEIGKHTAGAGMAFLAGQCGRGGAHMCNGRSSSLRCGRSTIDMCPRPGGRWRLSRKAA